MMEIICSAGGRWRRPAGRPRTTWLRTIGEDLQSQNFGVHTAWRKAKERDTWHQVVSMATLCYEFAAKKKKKGLNNRIIARSTMKHGANQKIKSRYEK